MIKKKEKKEKRKMIKIHTECGKQEDNNRSELNINHCLIERKLATVVFVALAYSCMQQFIESSTYT
jgi:hypothetical protein